MKNISFFVLFSGVFLFSCSNNKPGDEKMRACLSKELSNKAIVVSFDQQDGLAREKDGIKYYEGYFNAEIKFIANLNQFKAGDKYKIIRGTVSFMKTENGWNCQSFDLSAANLVKIKEQGDPSTHINAGDNNLTEASEQTNNKGASEDTLTVKQASPTSATRYAVINDPDGFTNVREGIGTESKIIDKIYEGEKFEVFPSAQNSWWLVVTKSNKKGYIHKSRVKLVD